MRDESQESREYEAKSKDCKIADTISECLLKNKNGAYSKKKK